MFTAILIAATTVGSSFAVLQWARLSPLPAGAWDWPDDLGLTASAAPVTFRDGDGGPYGETDDAYIASSDPNANFGANPKLFVDGSGCKVSTTSVCKTLIKFPSFIGPNSGQVPLGSTIVDATLDLVITNKGWTQDVYQVTQSWSETGATWNSFSPAGTPGTKPLDQVIAPRTLGLFAINITSIVQRWADGEPNEGILLASTHSDGVDYESSESANPPALRVQFVPPTQPPPSPYEVRDLGTLPGHTNSVARGINEAGQVVGWSWNSTETRAFLWEDGTMRDLGIMKYSWAFDINDLGQVVGYWSFLYAGDEGPNAFLWEGGEMTNLTLDPDDDYTAAFGINNAGQIVGYGFSGLGSHAYLWEDGTATDLGNLGGTENRATAINDAGQIVGSSADREGTTHAFLWENGTMTDLGIWEYSQAFDINDREQVVGFWSFISGAGSPNAFLWDDGDVTNLTLHPDDDYTAAFAINNAGQVVGFGFSGLGSHATLWEDGTLTHLGNLGGTDDNIAWDINDAGQIVGQSQDAAGGTRAVLWSKSAPPAPPSEVTVTFQKGDGGAYSETDDAFIYNGSPNTNYGTNPKLFVDALDCISAGTVCRSLLRFPGFIGSNSGQVPLGAVIVSATLTFTITNSGGTQTIFQVTEAWTESGVTWNAFAIPGSPATKGDGISFAAPLGTVKVDITAIVQAWVNGDANLGLLIRSTSTNGADYESSESTTPPALTIVFRPP